MRNRVWGATLATAAVALNLFNSAVRGSGGEPLLGQGSNTSATADSRASKQRREAIRKIIAETLKVKLMKVVPEARFVEDLDGHSLSLAECRYRIEEAFQIEIPDKEAQTLLRVRDVFAYVEAHARTSQ